ncbi:AIG2-like family [Aspergillus sclerotialis]|uniref:AIG2-like family n=1 Tax=Aspergillus sclerotialis TaxID=2070753 RepID=A0A3A2ZGS4_9EURO|nr:AIG2-like family [Aspergillus sclerotialis]
MDFKQWYPKDFILALSNTLTEKEVTLFLQKPGSSPRFVYGILMLPTVLKYYIDMDQAVEIDKSMTQATLFGYQLYQFADSSPPVIVRSSDPKAVVDGMLIFNLNERQRNSIYELEGGLMDLVSAQVEICEEDCRGERNLRSVEAGTFAWENSKEGLISTKTTSWGIDGFLNSPFYENIDRAQRRTSLESSAPGGVCRPARMLSAVERGRRGSTSSLLRRYRASLTSIYEGSETHDT